ncbi:MAG: cytochrome c biogenesis protein CcdA, partial [Thermodesulfobacteriota bacterium]|nr:cytochrome c biogenesis protein CcdA [Thermodesulfobacteriota bacterium]
LIGIFLGGLALNLTPCVYPLIPITVSYFGGMSHKSLGRSLVHGLLYISGLAFTNSLLGLTAGLSGGMLGSALQNPIVLILVAGILVALALSFFGLWELRLPTGLTKLASKNFGGYLGTCFMGLTLGIVAAPCLGPFILGLLTYVGQKGDPFFGFMCFFVLSIGLGLPLMILAVFSGYLERLPMSGAWMVWVRKILGWVLVGMAGYLLLPLVSNPVLRSALLSSILVAGGLHLGWLEGRSALGSVFPKIKKAVGIILVATGVAFMLVPFRSGVAIHWIPYDQALLLEAGNKAKPVILDFYADWCGPCKALEKKVFRDPDVVELSRRFVSLRVDLTKRHPRQNELLGLYQVRGVPTIIFINGQGAEERTLRVESYISREELLHRMQRLLP